MDQYRPGTKVAENLFSGPKGATMAEIIKATGGPQYNVLRKLEGRGYRIRKVKDGRATRYFAEPPAQPSFTAKVTSKGQVTLPKEVRERLRLREGDKIRFTAEEDGRIVMARGGHSIRDMFGILGKPPRSLTLKEIDEVIRQAAVDRFRRAVGRKK